MHAEAARNLRLLDQLLAAGLSPNAEIVDGLTLLNFAIHHKDSNAVHQLLSAGADPLLRSAGNASPLVMALVSWPQIAPAIVEALPNGIKATIYEGGWTELHLAIRFPELLHVLLSKGMVDSPDDQNRTVLFVASHRGASLSVKYLLGHRPAGEPEENFRRYLNTASTTLGHTALGAACGSNHAEIVDLLIRHGASLQAPAGQPSLVKQACDQRKINLLQLLLESGAATFEPDMVGRLINAVNTGWTKGVTALGKHLSLSADEQRSLLMAWTKNPRSDLLAAISPLISNTVPGMDMLVKQPSILKLPVQRDNAKLLCTLLEFFEPRESFGFAIQSLITQFFDKRGALVHRKLGQALLWFALQPSRLTRLCSDRETIMRLLQLSEQLKDYTLITLIKEKNLAMPWLAGQKIPFHSAWIQDPVSLELLGITKGQALDEFPRAIDTLNFMVSSFNNAEKQVDAAQLSNDLIFALKSDTASTALDKVFDVHRISAIVRQALQPLLGGMVTQLYPDPADRHEAVCRFVIAYAFSTLQSNPRLTQHAAYPLLMSHPQWLTMSMEVGDEILALDNMATTILDTMKSAQLWQTLPDETAQLAIESLAEKDPEAFLTAAFRSRGALDVPARRLAQACANAVRVWKKRGSSSTGSDAARKEAQLALKALISAELDRLRKLPKLPEELAKNVMNVAPELNPDFHQMLWWQWDLIHQAFGIAIGNPSASEARTLQDKTES